MKYVLIAISVFVVSGGLLAYTTRVLPPMESGFIVARNLTFVLTEICMMLGAFFTLIHMVVDLVITKRVILSSAVRRGLLFGLLCTGVLWMRVYGVFTLVLAGLWVLTMIVIEVIIIELRR